MTVLSLRGAGGEPVDFARVVFSHGVAALPPSRRPPDGRWLELTLPVPGRRPRTVRVAPDGRANVGLSLIGPRAGAHTSAVLADQVRHVLRLDEDLSPFYALAADDPELSWVTSGAGRLARCPTAFEEVVKTVCTTNCSWAATERMVTQLVTHLGDRAIGGAHAFPTPEAMAAAPESFYRDVVRAGYRSGPLRRIAVEVAEQRVDLESLATGPGIDPRIDPRLDDDEVERRLLALPGVGPYAAAHVMLMLGRYSRLVLDSWTRPTYARLSGRRSATDAVIARRFARYGRWRGLAFWCYLTRGWLPARSPVPPAEGDPTRSATPGSGTR